jgi:rhodanese-related sulfurtransferase
MALPPEISVADLKAMRDAGAAFVLLDVREDDELAVARVAFARHMPMNGVPNRLDELPKDADIVVMCHSGYRSGIVAGYLREHGFASVANLAGGIDRWSREIDPAVPVY